MYMYVIIIIILYIHFLESSLCRTAFDDSKTEIELEFTVYKKSLALAIFTAFGVAGMQAGHDQHHQQH